MASKFSDVYDSLVTRLAVLWPSKSVIPYPYSLSDSPVQFLKDGYGIKVGGASNSELTTDYLSSVSHTISIILVREVSGFSSLKTSLVAETKTIYDDIYDLKNALLNLSRVSPMFNGEPVVYDSDSGIEDVIGDKQRFISLESVFTFDLTQEINQ